MSNYIWFDGKRVMAGAADIKTSGKSVTDAFTKLDGAGSPITAIEAEHPGGDDEAGREFAGWYTEGKKQIVSMGKEIGEVITELGKNTELALAQFVKTDLEAADELKLD